MVVHHLASEDSLSKEVSSEMKMSDEQVGYVAFYPEFVGVCTLDKVIRNRSPTMGR